MKHYICTIREKCGGYEFDSRAVFKVESDQNPVTVAQAIAFHWRWDEEATPKNLWDCGLKCWDLSDLLIEVRGVHLVSDREFNFITEMSTTIGCHDLTPDPGLVKEVAEAIKNE